MSNEEKIKLMQELIDRYQQLEWIKKDETSSTTLELYICELENRLIKRLGGYDKE